MCNKNLESVQSAIVKTLFSLKFVSSEDYKILKWISDNTEVIYKEGAYEKHLESNNDNEFILPAGIIENSKRFLVFLNSEEKFQ